MPADCYCVLLHADLASSWRLPAAQAPSGAAPAAATDPVAAAAAGLAAMGLSEPPSSGSLQQGPASRHGSSGSVASSAGGAGGGAAGWQQQQPQSAVVFSGFVSHQQLTAALGSRLSGDPVRQVLRAAAAAAKGPRQLGLAADPHGKQEQPLATCRVSMRGPGGRGHADVAVSSFPPSSDAGHLPVAAPGAQQLRPASSRPWLVERAQQLARGVAAAAKQASAQAAGVATPADLDPSQLRLKCALMSLQLPVEMLAESVLQALPAA